MEHIDLEDDDRPAETPVEALRWAVMSQRALAFNLGYLDVPTHEDELLPEMPWQQLSELHQVEYTLINDFIIDRVRAGEMWATTQYTTRPDEDDE